MSSTTKVIINLSRIYLVLILVAVLSSCAVNQNSIEVQTKVSPPVVKAALSPLPISNISVDDIKFAQAALKQLGFNIGLVDGIWGPRSAQAILQFENEHQLVTANGHLSELNFSRLNDLSSIKKEDIESMSQTINTNEIQSPGQGISKKLDTQAQLDDSPQLIITEQAYTVLVKPNPYSETATILPAGEGIYVINLQDGWYEVESLDRIRGYIKE